MERHEQYVRKAEIHFEHGNEILALLHLFSGQLEITANIIQASTKFNIINCIMKFCRTNTQ
jgi:hypothetical protein